MRQFCFAGFLFYQCRISISVSLFCVLNTILDNFILMKNNMKEYIGSVYSWSHHAFCNINPTAQTTSGGGLGRIPDQTGHV